MEKQLVTGLVFTTFFVVVIAVQVDSVDQNETMKKQRWLNISTITKETIEGEYHTSSESIHFRSNINGVGFSLSITTTDGDPIFTVVQPHESAMTMSINDTDFLIVEFQRDDRTTQQAKYIVPKIFCKHVERAIVKHNRLLDKLLQYLDDRGVNETHHSAFTELATCHHADLISDAAEALGSLGVNGEDNPAAMPFYVLALRLIKHRDHYLSETDNSESVYITDDAEMGADAETKHRMKHSTCSFGRKCAASKCPRRSNNCLGMCGRRCKCWRLLCGDCCIHKGCLEHDLCCKKHGMLSTQCWSLTKFSCSAYRKRC